jgi:hypothetical protein
MERIIDIFCDDCSTWDELNSITEVVRKRINKTNEPYIEFKLFNILWRCFIYGMNNTDLLPQKLKNASHEGCRPDIWFYDRNDDKILLGVEQTLSAPVGNALKQRITRPFWALENNVGFVYVSPIIGMDQSQKKTRKQTGPFLQFRKLNPSSFITPDEFSLETILEEISINDIEKYKLSHNFNFKKMGKSRVSVKKTNVSFLTKLFSLINGDDMVYNIIEPKGNIYMINKDSVTAKHLDLNQETILVIGKCWKSKNSSGYSDPLSGGILMMWYINKWLGGNTQIVVVSTDECQKYNTIDFICHNNKMTLSLSKVDFLIDSCGISHNVKHVDIDTFKYKGDDESIATYSRAQDLRKQGITLDFIQYPHGSWSSNDGKNTQKRDKKRADIYHNNAINGEEGKTKLSDIYKHIKKYGLIHDYYYYLVEDCKVDQSLNNKCIKVDF